MRGDEELLTGVVMDETLELTTDELCRTCRVRREIILSMVEEGILTPLRRDDATWRFAGRSVDRAMRAARLQRDLELNLPGVALVLDLMDEIARLRERLRTPD